MNLRRCESPGDTARIAALSADQAPTAIIGSPHMGLPPFGWDGFVADANDAAKALFDNNIAVSTPKCNSDSIDDTAE
jgi:cytolysin (calcineurin-like family phosphatase)